MRIRNRLVVLVVVAGSFAMAQSASATLLLMPLPVPPVLPLVGSVLALAPVNPLSPVCPQVTGQVPGTAAYRCVVTIAPGTTLECESGTTGTYGFTVTRTGCGITSAGLTAFCGDTATADFRGSNSQEGCDGMIGTTVVSVGCMRGGADHVGDWVGCTVGPVSYTETLNSNGTSPTQTLAIGNIKYVCVNDACQLLTS